MENTKTIGHSARKPCKERMRGKRYFFIYCMILPAVINFAIFYVWINFNSIAMGFKVFMGYDGEYNEMYRWSLDNFKTLFKELPLAISELHIGILNTLKYFAAGLLITLPLSYFASYFLFKKIPGYKFFRIVFFLPSIISAIVYVAVFRNVILTYGPIDTMWQALFGKNFPLLLSNDKTATNTIVFYTIWTGFGVNMLLYQGAMTRLPQEVIEAGKLDGVGWCREMLQIISPMIWPTLSTTIILQLSTMFQATGPILLFADTGSIGGTYKTTTISFWLFQKTWMQGTGGALEYPAAVGVFFTLLGLPVVLFVRWFFNRIDPEVEY